MNANNSIILNAKIFNINRKKILLAIITITSKSYLSIKVIIQKNIFNWLNSVNETKLKKSLHATFWVEENEDKKLTIFYKLYVDVNLSRS